LTLHRNYLVDGKVISSEAVRASGSPPGAKLVANITALMFSCAFQVVPAWFLGSSQKPSIAAIKGK
jgi:hypothetical protein